MKFVLQKKKETFQRWILAKYHMTRLLIDVIYVLVSVASKRVKRASELILPSLKSSSFQLYPIVQKKCQVFLDCASLPCFATLKNVKEKVSWCVIHTFLAKGLQPNKLASACVSVWKNESLFPPPSHGWWWWWWWCSTCSSLAFLLLTMMSPDGATCLS